MEFVDGLAVTSEAMVRGDIMSPIVAMSGVRFSEGEGLPPLFFFLSVFGVKDDAAASTCRNRGEESQRMIQVRICETTLTLSVGVAKMRIVASQASRFGCGGG